MEERRHPLPLSSQMDSPQGRVFTATCLQLGLCRDSKFKGRQGVEVILQETSLICNILGPPAGCQPRRGRDGRLGPMGVERVGLRRGRGELAAPLGREDH